MKMGAALGSLMLLTVATVGPASSASAAQATRCTGTLSGTYKHVVVPAGERCVLSSATVTGNVTVKTGGVLIARDTDVRGNIRATDAKRIRIVGDEDTRLARNIFARDTGRGGVTIGSTNCKVDPPVAHNVMVTGTTGPVAICYVSTKNNIKVTGNTGGVGLFHNRAGTNIQVRNNSTGTATNARPGIRLRSNHADVNIACRANDPAPTGRNNTAKHMTGQCAGMT